jgi:LysR family hca operon transcriptional activator
VEWLRHVTHVLQSQLKDIDFRVSSDFSPAVGEAIQRGDIDLGICRLELHPDVTYKVIEHEPILVFLPRDHPLAACSAIDARDLDPGSFIGYSATTHILRGIVDRYFHDRGITMSPTRFLDGVATGISLVASTGGRHAVAGLRGENVAALCREQAAHWQCPGNRDRSRLPG